MWARFLNYFEIDTAIVSDSIMAGIIVNGAAIFSLSGGKISDFAHRAKLKILRNYKTGHSRFYWW